MNTPDGKDKWTPDQGYNVAQKNDANFYFSANVPPDAIRVGNGVKNGNNKLANNILVGNFGGTTGLQNSNKVDTYFTSKLSPTKIVAKVTTTTDEISQRVSSKNNTSGSESESNSQQNTRQNPQLLVKAATLEGQNFQMVALEKAAQDYGGAQDSSSAGSASTALQHTLKATTGFLRQSNNLLQGNATTTQNNVNGTQGNVQNIGNNTAPPASLLLQNNFLSPRLRHTPTVFRSSNVTAGNRPLVPQLQLGTNQIGAGTNNSGVTTGLVPSFTGVKSPNQRQSGSNNANQKRPTGTSPLNVSPMGVSPMGGLGGPLMVRNPRISHQPLTSQGPKRSLLKNSYSGTKTQQGPGKTSPGGEKISGTTQEKDASSDNIASKNQKGQPAVIANRNKNNTNTTITPSQRASVTHKSATTQSVSHDKKPVPPVAGKSPPLSKKGDTATTRNSKNVSVCEKVSGPRKKSLDVGKASTGAAHRAKPAAISTKNSFAGTTMDPRNIPKDINAAKALPKDKSSGSAAINNQIFKPRDGPNLGGLRPAKGTEISEKEMVVEDFGETPRDQAPRVSTPTEDEDMTPQDMTPKICSSGTPTDRESGTPRDVAQEIDSMISTPPDIQTPRNNMSPSVNGPVIISPGTPSDPHTPLESSGKITPPELLSGPSTPSSGTPPMPGSPRNRVELVSGISPSTPKEFVDSGATSAHATTSKHNMVESSLPSTEVESDVVGPLMTCGSHLVVQREDEDPERFNQRCILEWRPVLSKIPVSLDQPQGLPTGTASKITLRERLQKTDFRKIGNAQDANVCCEEECVYISSGDVARNRKQLLGEGITHIINAAGDICENLSDDDGASETDSPNKNDDTSADPGMDAGILGLRNNPDTGIPGFGDRKGKTLDRHFSFLTFYYKDGKGEDITNGFYRTLDFIRGAYLQNNNAKILFHCGQGVSRSSTLCIMYSTVVQNIYSDVAINFESY